VLALTCPREVRPIFVFLFASSLVPLATEYLLPVASRHLRQLAIRGQPIESLPMVSLHSNWYAAKNCFVALEPATGEILSVPLRRGEKPPGYAEPCRVLVSGSRFGSHWITHGIAPP
jgi:hypothetical protein